jgi:hypothetical protein
MPISNIQQVGSAELTHEAIREQLDVVVKDPAFRSSKRSVQFLRYVVEKTLSGSADQIKERTIGVEVFGRDPSYDTNVDHVVRTAAIELRKRLAIYYGEEKHRSELKLNLVPGSYIPHFAVSAQTAPLDEEYSPSTQTQTKWASPDGPDATTPNVSLIENQTHQPRSRFGILLTVAVVVSALLVGALLSNRWLHPATAQDLFWKPVFDTPGSVLLAVGDVPDGPPTPSSALIGQNSTIPVIHRTSSSTVPFADTVTTARILGILAAHDKQVIIRRESASSFSDLRQSPVVLIGAFNNEWSLRLTQQLRYTMALDPEKHLIYIRDTKSPDERNWSWETNQPADHHGEATSPVLQDYALISRIWNSETGRVVVVVGGLYTYGTEAAGEFLSDPRWMQTISGVARLSDPHLNVQIVLGTTVTDGTAGPPKVLAVSVN